MRDHPWHGVTFMAGLWAAKLWMPEVRQKMKEAWKLILQDKDAFAPRTERLPDMFVLERQVKVMYFY